MIPVHALFVRDSNLRLTKHNPQEVDMLRGEIEFSFNLGNAHDEWNTEPKEDAILALYGPGMRIIEEKDLPEMELVSNWELENFLNQCEEDKEVFSTEE